ncbi:copper resistance protein CopC [Allopusillimonas soli]|uniref:Copper resistance protein CopC/CopD n=1 Tax=Allopusillimonas soli TaxID=659016 RepID=A0A853F5W7_9BURK|nr:copper resistance protein CopC [Allopusillimonas soli]NYT35357.1 copper resistance protein CopC/CopD [Allopusillimonas soli]TEA75776.1 copper resistance protein CopC [Allopusillimonas soli]
MMTARRARAWASGLLALMLCLAGLLVSPRTWAHASLVEVEPANGALLAAAPAKMTFSFNEAVSPTVLKLLRPDGRTVVLDRVAQHDNTFVVDLPRLQQHGTYGLSWRVVSADGHPVGGTTLFSFAVASAVPGGAQADHAFRSAGIWLLRLMSYMALFSGIGAVFHRYWLSQTRTDHAHLSIWPQRRIVTALLALAVFAGIVYTGLFGLDALDLGWAGLLNSHPWRVAASSTVGLAALLAIIACFAAATATWTRGLVPARGLAALAVVLVGLSLAVTGHASQAPPQWLSRPAVWLHGVAVVFWIGALMGLAVRPCSGEEAYTRGLRLFSAWIPWILAGLLASGVTLACLQLGHLSALWTTRYGVVLVVKLMLVSLLLGLGAFNRYKLTQRVLDGDAVGQAGMRSIVLLEIVVAAAILAVVAFWRFTPPPRTMAFQDMAQPAMDHHHASGHVMGSHAATELHARRASARLDVVHAQGGQPMALRIELLDAQSLPLKAQEVDISFYNRQAGIEPVRYAAGKQDGVWIVPDLRLPAVSHWTVEVDALISDFERIRMVGDLALQ